jgi:hypothetical protein
VFVDGDEARIQSGRAFMRQVPTRARSHQGRRRRS